MKLAYLSDLHLEFGTTGVLTDALAIHDSIKSDADILIVAGDIAEIKHLKRSSSSTMYYCREALESFFEGVCNHYKHVIYVLGNHEYYHSLFEDVEGLVKESLNHPNLHILENNWVVLEGTAFYGGTAWTDLSNYWDASAAEYGMNDFKVIRTGAYRKFKPHDATLVHTKFVQGLEAFKYTFKRSNAKMVVVSHHAPSFKSVAPEFEGNSLNPAFVSDLTGYMEGITLWAHGHTHSKFDYYCGDTRVVCNPRGYQGMEQIVRDFKVEVVEI